MLVAGEGGVRTYRVTPLLEEVEEGIADLRRSPLLGFRHGGVRRGGDVGIKAALQVKGSVPRVVCGGEDSRGVEGSWRKMKVVESSTRMSQRYKRRAAAAAPDHLQQLPHLAEPTASATASAAARRVESRHVLRRRSALGPLGILSLILFPVAQRVALVGGSGGC